MISSRVLRALLVSAILALALGVRIDYVQTTPYKAVNDAGTYNRLASMVAQHGDYDTGSAPGSGAAGSRGPTAYFPPGLPVRAGRWPTSWTAIRPVTVRRSPASGRRWR